jgi:GntR family transcriptional regulator, transcriptional repressor for pyruvate dehydrogenase complex
MTARTEPDVAAPFSLAPIRRIPLYEHVVERLREFIDVQKLKPGDRLMSERDLARALGVSRTSLRQALTALRVVGMIDVRQGDGIYLIRAPADVLSSLAVEVLHSYAEYPMIMEVREALESHAAALAARRRTDHDLAGMRDGLDEMAAAIESGEDGAEGDKHFHGAVVAAAHNSLLTGIVDQLFGLIDATSEASLARPGQPARSLAAHREIYACIDGRDEALAARRMHDHLRVTGDLDYVPHEG